MFFSTLLLLLLSGCSTVELQTDHSPVQLHIIQKIDLGFIPAKCVYSSTEKTAFILEENTNYIHIYRNEKKINTIGGLGFENINFNELSDITISPDGKLLVLDSFQKKIKKFDKDGKWITEFDLVDFSEPRLFDISIDETFYIYDDNRKEIIISKYLNEKDFYTFGKFQLTDPQKLLLTKNSVVVFDSSENKTIVFDTLGQFLVDYNGNYQFDGYHTFKLESYNILHCRSNNKFAASTKRWKDFYINGNFVILLSESEVWIAQFIYQQQPGKY